MKLIIEALDGTLIDFNYGYLSVRRSFLTFSDASGAGPDIAIAFGTQDELRSLRRAIAAWLSSPTGRMLELPVWIIPIEELLDAIRSGE